MFMNKFKIVLKIWKFLYKYEKFDIVWGIALSLGGLYSIITVLLSKEIVDSIIDSSSILNEGIPDSIIWGLLLGGIMLFHGTTTAFSNIKLANIKDKIESRVDKILMSKISKSFSISEFEIAENHDKIRLATLGGQSLPLCFADSFQVLQLVLTALGLLVVLSYYHPLIAVCVFAPTIPLFYSQAKVRSSTYAAMVNISPKFRCMGYFIELMLGVNTAKEIKTFKSGSFFLSKYSKVANEIFNFSNKLRLRVGLTTILWGCVSACGVGLAYLYVIYMASIGEITIGDVVLYSGAVFYSGATIRGLIQMFSNFWAKLLEVDSFFNYVEEESSIQAADSIRIPKSNGVEWRIKNINYKYPGRDDYALDGVSFSINLGEKIAIVGANGAGKSTLVQLMLGLLEPSSGVIEYKGCDVRCWNKNELINEIGVVFQDFSKFKLTLFENILLSSKKYGSSKDREQAVIDAAKQTDLDSFAHSLNDKYSTMLGREFQHGTELSGGQWQKVALARAFIREAKVIFLDEPTSALDVKTEQSIFEKFLALSKDKTAFLISHRLSVTPLVDRILTFEEGRLIEEGNHSELIQLDGKYASLYKTQSNMYW